MLKSKNNNLKFIVINGELCGGFYREDINNWKGPIPTRISEKGIVIIPLEKRAVQEGVYYSDKIKHIVFDIALINNQNKIKYLEYDEIVKIYKEFKIPFTPILVKGSLLKLLYYSLEFKSTIPWLFGLKCFKNNKAERIVIKPFLWKRNGEDRPMLKKKDKSFMQILILKKLKNPFFSAICMINLNILYGVISKVGSKNNKEKIINEFVEDVWNSIWEIGVNVTYYDQVDNYIKENVIKMVDEYINNLK